MDECKTQQDGHEIKQASELLTLFEDMKALHVADRDRLLKELGIA